MKRKNPIKFAFVGTSCVYKTTLIEHYRSRFVSDKRFMIVEEAARLFFSQNKVPYKNRFRFPAQSKIQSLALKNEKEAHKSRAEIIFCDRSVLDAVVYVLTQGDVKGAEKLFERVKKWLNTYTLFFLLDPEGVTFGQDEVRLEDATERMCLHEEFVKFFKRNRLAVKFLTGSLNQRISEVDKTIGRYLKL